jgi:histidinol-phosphate aminotransferase
MNGQPIGVLDAMKLKIPDYILDIAPYVPGKPIEELEREYGIGDSIKLASNENPLGPSPKAMEAIARGIAGLHRYPDGAGHLFLNALADNLNLSPNQIVMGNGSDDILGLLSRALLQPGDEAIIPTPSFLMYLIVTQSAGAVPVHVPLLNMGIDLEEILRRVTPRTRLIFICNPNNPTGSMLTQEALQSFLGRLPTEVVVVLDEAYIEFVRDPRCARGLSFLDGDATVVTLRTFSKIYGLAGLRVGYGVMPQPLAQLLNRIRMPFNVNSLAQAAAAAALEDTEFFEKTRSLIHEGLDSLFAELTKRGLRSFPTQTNFFLIDMQHDARVVFDRFLRQGVIVRAMSAYGFPEYIRINVGLPEENRHFLSALDKVMAEL